MQTNPCYSRVDSRWVCLKTGRVGTGFGVPCYLYPDPRTTHEKRWNSPIQEPSICLSDRLPLQLTGKENKYSFQLMEVTNTSRTGEHPQILISAIYIDLTQYSTCFFCVLGALKKRQMVLALLDRVAVQRGRQDLHAQAIAGHCPADHRIGPRPPKHSGAVRPPRSNRMEKKP